MRSRVALFVVLLVVPAFAFAGVPDPTQSTCIFPAGAVVCGRRVEVDVTVVDDDGAAVSHALVQVTIQIVGGSLDPGQDEIAEAVADDFGHATVAFPDGVLGSGHILFEVFANGIKIAESAEYSLEPTCMRVVPHLKERADSTFSCEEAWDLPCSQFSTAGRTGVSYDLYLVVAHADPNEGIAGLSIGIDYDGSHPPNGQGVGVFSWQHCADLHFPRAGWPGPNSGNQITWAPSSNCQDDPIVGYEEEGAHAVTGALYVYAYDAGTFHLTPNTSVGSVPVAEVADCDAERFVLSTASLGSVEFTAAGINSGYNPCAEPPPPLPPPTPPPPPPVNASVMLHVQPVNYDSPPCQAAPDSVEDVVTSAPASPDGSTSYFVYLLGTPPTPGDPVGLTGFQLGIQYDESTEAGEGIHVWNWVSCAYTEFNDHQWPASGSGNTIVWPPVQCRTTPVVVAGYFYLTAYDPGVMSIVGWPQTGLVKVADCEGAESLPDLAVDITRVGWVSYGNAAKQNDTDGCNPALEPCNQAPVPVRQVSWGQLKSGH